MNSKRTLEASIEEACEVLSRLVVPLYIDVNEKPALVGTAFFVTYEDQTLLVSAAHVLDVLRTSNLYYYIEPAVKQRVLGRVLQTKYEGPRGKDPIDLGVVRLLPGLQPPYAAVQKFPMTAEYLDYWDAPSKGKRYVLIGFPASRSTLRRHPSQVIVKPYAYLAWIAESKVGAPSGTNPAQLALHFDKKRCHDLSGKATQFPKPHGLSGSPIFELYDEDSTTASRIFQVAGIVTTWGKQNHEIIGTRVHELRQILSAATAA